MTMFQMAVLLLFLLLAAVVYVGVMLRLKKRKGALKENLYILKDGLFSPAERSFYGVLQIVVKDRYLVFGKVRMEDVIIARSGLARDKRNSARGRIKSRHFDFVLCRPDTLAFVCAIELDDQTHSRPNRIQSDAFVNETCKRISLPLLRVPAKSAYSLEAIANQLDQLLKVPEPKNQVPMISKTGDEPVQVPDVTIHACARCGSAMARRTYRTGPRTGEEFWGCATFPNCWHIEEIELAKASETT